MNEELLKAIEDLSVHDHLCLMYKTRSEQFAAVIPFMRIGISRGEKCIYIADDNTAQEVIAAMRKDGIDTETAFRTGALSVVTKAEAYLRKGYFDPDEMILFLKECTDAAKKEGFSALRATGEMTWILGGGPGVSRLLEYEAKLNYFFPENDCLAICQYNINRFDNDIMNGVLYTHPLVIVGGTVCHNFYYIPPDRYLADESKSPQIDFYLANLLDRERIEKALKKSELRLSEAQNVAHIGNWEWNPQANELDCSPEVYRLCGLPEELGLSLEEFLELVHPDDLELVRRSINAALKGAPLDIQIRIIRPDGRELILQVKAKVYSDEREIPERVFGTIQDITESKHKDLEYKTLLNVALDGFWLMDTQGCFLDANPAYCRLIGYSRDELLNMRVQDVEALETCEESENRIRRIIEVGWDRFETAHRCKDGSTVDLEISVNYLEIAGGRLAVYLRDITQRKRVEKALQKNQELLKITQEITQAGGWEYDVDSGRMEWTQGVYQIYGVKPDDFDPNDISQDVSFYSQEDQTLIENAFLRAIKEGVSYDLELKFKNLRGEDLWVRTIGKVEQVDGKVVRVYGNIVDVSKHKLIEEALKESILKHKQDEAAIRQLNEELEQRVKERTAQLETSNKDLESFAYSIAHDLRAPLRAINSFSNILVEDYSNKLDDEGRRVLERIQSNTVNMGALIDDLLSFSRIGRQQLSSSQINMSNLAKAVFEDLKSMCPERAIQFTVGDLPPATGDLPMVRQVFVNLLSNAVKFTGRRECAAIEVGSYMENGASVYYIKDNGVGFDMKYANKLFLMFQRLHDKKDYEGTGVGLAIVHSIILRHGGRIWAEGEPGKGAAFYFTFSS